jgi:glycosyltransferase involved in cell wall biosynthesis
MIVKNESKVIKECLESVKNFIDYWVIVDTGSSDGTQQIIKEFMKDVPGELHEQPWVNFEHNRNRALDLAKNKSDYIFFIDADETLVFDDDFTMPNLDKDYYHIFIQESSSRYKTVALVNNNLNWKWKGVLHEAIFCNEAKTLATLEKVINISKSNLGARSQDPKKYEKDAAILEKALLEDPTNSRYVSFLGQSYRNAKKYDLALKAFKKRSTMGGWDQEVFYSLYNVGVLQEILEKPSQEFIANYCKAYQFRPSRAEPLYRIGHYHNRNKNYILGYLILKFALSIPTPNDTVHVENWIYDFGLLYEYAQSSTNLEKYEEAINAYKKILTNKNVPLMFQKASRKNLAILEFKKFSIK